MPRRIVVFTNKFFVGQRIRNTITGYTGTVVEVDPNSYNPPKGRARHNPYRIRFDHWVLPGLPWDREDELEALDPDAKSE